MMGLEQDGGLSTWPMSRRRRSGMSEINITAFVDVLLVLLIIFMMTSQYLRAGFDVDLPNAETPSLTPRTDPIVVTLSTDRRLSVGDKAVQGLDDLQRTLEAELGASRDRPVYLKADKAVPYGTIVGVMSRIRKAGIADIGLMTESGPEDFFNP